MPRPNKYLDELISYGGQPFTRAEVIADMQRCGTPQPLIDRWLQGQEQAARREGLLNGTQHLQRPLHVRDVTFKKAPRSRAEAPKTSPSI